MAGDGPQMTGDDVIDRLLRARGVPEAPAQFTSRAMAIVRRDRRRRERAIDVGFNFIISVAAIAIVLVAWVLLLRSGLLEASGAAFDLLTGQTVELARRAAPSVP